MDKNVARGKTRPRVLFFEPNHTGHHLAYLGRMMPGFLALPIDAALATTDEATRSEEFRRGVAEFTPRLEVLTPCKPGRGLSPMRIAWNRLAELRDVVEAWRPDHVCLMYADGIWPLLAAGLGGGPLRGKFVEAWVYRGGFSYPDATSPDARVKRWLWLRWLRSGHITKVHPVDELLLDFANGVSGSRAEVALAADPVELLPPLDRDEARRRLRIDFTGPVAACIGMADTRKGVDLAIAAVVRLHALHAETAPALLIAGPHSDEVRSLLKSDAVAPLVASGRIVSADRYLNAEEMFLYAAASDVVLAPYPNQSGRSSIILWGAAAGRPVVGAARGCIGRVVRGERLGATCDPRDTAALAATILQTLAAPWTAEDVRRCRDYAEWHSVPNYQRMSAELVRRRCEAQG